MSNILADPNAWTDLQTNSPPAAWDGTLYDWLGFFGSGGPAQGMTFTGDVGEMPLSMTFSVITGTNVYSVDTKLVVTINGAPTEYPLDPSATQEITINTAGATALRFDLVSGPEDQYPYSYSMNVSLVPGSAVDPALGDPYVIRGTHRAIEGGDNPQVAWVRSETGRLDLTAAESLTVDIQRGSNKLLTIPATGDATGRLDFTITSANIKQKLSLLGLFRLYARADGRVIYTGLLEVLG